MGLIGVLAHLDKGLGCTLEASQKRQTSEVDTVVVSIAAEQRDLLQGSPAHQTELLYAVAVQGRFEAHRGRRRVEVEGALVEPNFAGVLVDVHHLREGQDALVVGVEYLYAALQESGCVAVIGRDPPEVLATGELE